MTAAAVKPDKPERWWRFVRKGRITCPLGHRMTFNAYFPEHGCTRCQHGAHDGQPACGRWIFIVSIGGGGNIIVELNVAEVREIERLGIKTPTEILDYLGVWPPFID
jgi:hypothetical protein